MRVFVSFFFLVLGAVACHTPVEVNKQCIATRVLFEKTYDAGDGGEWVTAAISPDGSTIFASRSTVLGVQLWETKTGKKGSFFKTEELVSQITVSHDGSFLILGTTPKKLREKDGQDVFGSYKRSKVFNLRFLSVKDGSEYAPSIIGRDLDTAEYPRSTFHDLALGKDNKHLYVSYYGVESRLEKWDVKQGKKVAELVPSFSDGSEGYLEFELSADEKTLFLHSGGQGLIQFVDSTTGTVKDTLKLGRGVQQLILLSGTDTLLLSKNGALEVWGLKSKTMLSSRKFSKNPTSPFQFVNFQVAAVGADVAWLHTSDQQHLLIHVETGKVLEREYPRYLLSKATCSPIRVCPRFQHCAEPGKGGACWETRADGLNSSWKWVETHASRKSDYTVTLISYSKLRVTGC